MSEKQQNKTVLLPDGSAENNKLNEEDKYESRTETDSGFLSSGNLLVSGEITTTEEQEEPSIRKGDDEKDKEKLDKSYMHIDSGVDVCLSETFSSLSLKHPDLNDLNSKGEIKEYQRQQQQQQQQSISSKNRTIEEQPWQIYFEQDEDGDT